MKNQVCKSNNAKIIKQQKHKYFIKNQHKIQKKKQKKYYSENIDFVREKVKDYYESNRPAVREKQGSYFREKSFVVNEARRKNFRKRKLENQNPEDQTNNRITKLCKLCWEGPTFVCVVCKGIFTGMVLNYLIQVNIILILIVLFIKLTQREVGFFDM